MAQKQKHVFQIEHVSTVDNCTYSGTFACKKLSVKDITQLSVLKSKLNGGYYYDASNPGVGIDENTDGLNHMFSHLQVALVDKPDWFNLDEIGDLEVVTKVFQEVATFEASFRGSRGKDSDGVSPSPSTQAAQGSKSVGNAPTMVVHKVPASLDP